MNQIIISGIFGLIGIITIFLIVYIKTKQKESLQENLNEKKLLELAEKEKEIEIKNNEINLKNEELKNKENLLLIKNNELIDKEKDLKRREEEIKKKEAEFKVKEEHKDFEKKINEDPKETKKHTEDKLDKIKVENDKKKLDEQKKKDEETKKKADDKKKLDEQKKKDEEAKKKADDKKKLDEQKKKDEEAKKKADDDKKRLEEQKKKDEEAKKKADDDKKRLEEQKKKDEEAKKKADDELKKQAEEKKSFKEGLTKTKGFFAKIASIFSSKPELSEDLMEQLEELLLTSDIGPKTAEQLFQKVKEGMDKKSIKDSKAVMDFLKDESKRILDIPFTDNSTKNPYIILFIGVNGSGKTTTIGKLASQYKNKGKKVLLAAGDTFRAAAVDQLEIWAKRSESIFYSGKEGQDPSSVIFDAIKKGIEEKVDIIICDTSGRLHTDKKLMEELKKIKRVTEKALPGAPHDTFLVLDSTNGQNAIHQAKYFNEAMDTTGIVLTKMDGTAKGGVILGICDTYKIPVRYVGIGEGINDLREMDTTEFVEALYSND